MKLKPPFTGFRLRCGDYRAFFDLKEENTIEITAVRNRSGELIAELGKSHRFLPALIRSQPTAHVPALVQRFASRIVPSQRFSIGGALKSRPAW